MMVLPPAKSKEPFHHKQRESNAGMAHSARLPWALETAMSVQGQMQIQMPRGRFTRIATINADIAQGSFGADFGDEGGRQLRWAIAYYCP